MVLVVWGMQSDSTLFTCRPCSVFAGLCSWQPCLLAPAACKSLPASRHCVPGESRAGVGMSGCRKSGNGQTRECAIAVCLCCARAAQGEGLQSWSDAAPREPDSPAAIAALSYPSADKCCTESGLNRYFACRGAAGDKPLPRRVVRMEQRDSVDVGLREPRLDSCVPGLLRFPLLRGK